MGRKLLFLLMLLTTTSFYAQVGISSDGSVPDNSAMLDIKSTESGLLIPRMQVVDRDAINSPATGLTVYVIDDNTFYYYNGTTWMPIEVAGNSWLLSGNSGVQTTNFLGTTDANSLVFKTNNIERVRIKDNGAIGVNIAPNDAYLINAQGDTYDVIGNFLSTQTNHDDIGVYGEVAQTDYYGIGASFKAGWIGVRSTVTPTGNQYYYGVISSVKGGGGTNYGVLASADGDGNNYGIKGQASGTNADLRYGVYGYSTGDDTNNYGIYGEAFGNSNTNKGVQGIASGDSTNIGVYGTAEGGTDENIAIYGDVNTADNLGAAGYFKNNNDTGIGVLVSGNNKPMYYITGGAGLISTGGDFGLVGFADNTGDGVFGGYFEDGNGNYAVVAGRYNGTDYKILGNGSVSTVVPKSNTENVIMFAPEAPEIFFQDYGQGKLDKGRTHIDLDPIFAKNITVNDKHPLRVLIQLEGQSKGVYVTNKTNKGFDVIELEKGKSNVLFTYFVTANRKDGVDINGKTSKNADVRFPAFSKPKKIKKDIAKSQEKLIKGHITTFEKK